MRDGTVVIDLVGVVWLAGEPLAGAADAVHHLRAAGLGALFATNNSSPTIATLLQRLASAGIPAEPHELITAATAAASLISLGERVLVLGDPGVKEAVTAVGGLLVEQEPEVVVVGWDRSFTFDTIAMASAAIRAGARFIATNDDATHPTPNGLLPGTGALVAAVATAAEVAPTIAGKPGDAMVQLIRSHASDVVAVIGDRPATDGMLAEQLGVPFGHVLSDAVPSAATHAAHAGESLEAVVSSLLVAHGLR